MVKRVLIDDSLRYPDDCKGRTWIEYADSIPDVAHISSPEVLALELQYQPISGIPGYRLVEEKTLADGSIEVVQEFDFAPDVAYSLFKHWEEIDKAIQCEED